MAKALCPRLVGCSTLQRLEGMCVILLRNIETSIQWTYILTKFSVYQNVFFSNYNQTYLILSDNFFYSTFFFFLSTLFYDGFIVHLNKYEILTMYQNTFCIFVGSGQRSKNIQRNDIRRRFIFGFLGQQKIDSDHIRHTVGSIECNWHLRVRVGVRRLRR